MIKLGQIVRDRISGYTGCAAGRAEYLAGCVRVWVAPTKLRDDRYDEGQWFDEAMLDVLDRPAINGFATVDRQPQVRASTGAGPDPQRGPDAP